jgi:hypothetical protein
MNYTKPEVAVLGKAVGVIEATHRKDGTVIPDFPLPNVNPAYDLDE